jgi:thioredoxin 1
MTWAGWMALSLAALSVGYLLWSGMSAGVLKGQSVAPLESVLPGLADHRAKAVVYCFSEHCGPCRKMGPAIERLRSQHPNLFKLDVSQHPREARVIGVRATPTTLLVEDGTVLKALLGAGAVGAIKVFLRPS